jgi:hypothetical protein
MFRKSVLALAAVATVTAAALVPTTASAHYKGWWGGGWGFRTGVYLAAPLAYGGYYSYGYNCIRWVPTVYGYYVKRNVCVY